MNSGRGINKGTETMKIHENTFQVLKKPEILINKLSIGTRFVNVEQKLMTYQVEQKILGIIFFDADFAASSFFSGGIVDKTIGQMLKGINEKDLESLYDEKDYKSVDKK